MPIAQSYTTVQTTDELQQLINSCALNERSAQEKLYKMFYAKMLAVAVRYCIDRYEAEDIVNMGFLKCFQKIEKYNFQGSFEGWLRKIILRTALDHIRANEKYHEKTVFVDKDELSTQDLGERMYYNQLLALVEELPKTTKIVFNLSVMEGMTHKEIAEMIGISEGTSKWHLSEGRKMLKEKIEQLQLKNKF